MAVDQRAACVGMLPDYVPPPERIRRTRGADVGLVHGGACGCCHGAKCTRCSLFWRLTLKNKIDYENESGDCGLGRALCGDCADCEGV